MGVSHYGMTAKKVVADLSGERIPVRLMTCLDRNPTRSVESLQDQTRERYATADKAVYAVILFDAKTDPLHGKEVFRVPDDFDGTLETYDLEEWEVVGTLIERDKRVPRYRVETDERAVEQIRRDREFAAMKAGRLSVGQFYYDVDAYKASLEVRDAQSATGMVTRKHGFR